MNTSILKLKATVIRPKDDDELDGLAASISFPVECDDEANGMRGLYNSSDKKIMALIDMLDGNYPDHLSEKQKGEYLVGYYQQRSANIKDAEEKKNRKAAKIETNNTDTATTVATQKEK